MTVGTGASINSSGGNVSILTNSRSSVYSNGGTSSGDFLASVGSATSNASVTGDTVVTLGVNSEITASGDVDITPQNSVTGNTASGVSGGAAGFGGHTYATTTVNYLTETLIDGLITAGGNVNVVNLTIVDGLSSTDTDGLGVVGGSAHASSSVTIGSSGDPSVTKVEVGAGSIVTGYNVTLAADDQVTGSNNAYAATSGFAGGSSADADLVVYTDPQITLDSGSKIVGYDSVLLKADAKKRASTPMPSPTATAPSAAPHRPPFWTTSVTPRSGAKGPRPP